MQRLAAVEMTETLVVADATAVLRTRSGRIAVDLGTLARTVDEVLWEEDRNLRRT